MPDPPSTARLSECPLIEPLLDRSLQVNYYRCRQWGYSRPDRASQYRFHGPRECERQSCYALLSEGDLVDIGGPSMVMLIVFVAVLTMITLAMIGAVAYAMQVRIYEQPVDGFFWRIPACTAAVLLFWIVWIMLTFRYPGHTRPLHQASLDSGPAPFDEMQVVTIDDRVETYRRERTTAPGYPKYKNINEADRPLPRRLKEIKVKQDRKDADYQAVFKPESAVTPDLRKAKSVIYKDDSGRIMEEDGLGVLKVSGSGWFAVLLLLNLSYIALWMVIFTIGVGLPFETGAGLGIGAALLTAFTTMPFLIAQVEALALKGG